MSLIERPPEDLSLFVEAVVIAESVGEDQKRPRVVGVYDRRLAQRPQTFLEITALKTKLGVELAIVAAQGRLIDELPRDGLGSIHPAQFELDPGRPFERLRPRARVDLGEPSVRLARAGEIPRKLDACARIC